VSKQILSEERERDEIRDAIRKRPLWEPKPKVYAVRVRRGAADTNLLRYSILAMKSDVGNTETEPEPMATSETSIPANDTIAESTTNDDTSRSALLVPVRNTLSPFMNIPETKSRSTQKMGVHHYHWSKLSADGSYHPDTPMELVVTRFLVGRSSTKGAAGGNSTKGATGEKNVQGGHSNANHFHSANDKDGHADSNETSNTAIYDTIADPNETSDTAIYDTIVLPSRQALQGLTKIVPQDAFAMVTYNASELVSYMIAWSQGVESADTGTRPILTDGEYIDLVKWFKAIHGEAKGEQQTFNRIVELSLTNSPILDEVVAGAKQVFVAHRSGAGTPNRDSAPLIDTPLHVKNVVGADNLQDATFQSTASFSTPIVKPERHILPGSETTIARKIDSQGKAATTSQNLTINGSTSQSNVSILAKALPVVKPEKSILPRLETMSARKIDSQDEAATISQDAIINGSASQSKAARAPNSNFALHSQTWPLEGGPSSSNDKSFSIIRLDDYENSQSKIEYSHRYENLQGLTGLPMLNLASTGKGFHKNITRVENLSNSVPLRYDSSKMSRTQQIQRSDSAAVQVQRGQEHLALSYTQSAPDLLRAMPSESEKNQNPTNVNFAFLNFSKSTPSSPLLLTRSINKSTPSSPLLLTRSIQPGQRRPVTTSTDRGKFSSKFPTPTLDSKQAEQSNTFSLKIDPNQGRRGFEGSSVKNNGKMPSVSQMKQQQADKSIKTEKTRQTRKQVNSERAHAGAQVGDGLRLQWEHSSAQSINGLRPRTGSWESYTT
jgi:hypothetical protein